MSKAEDLFYQVSPPTVSSVDGKHRVLSVVTGAAGNYDWVSALGDDAPKGTCWLMLEAGTNDCYVRFKPTTAAAGTTATNGLIIKAALPGRLFWVDPVQHKVIDVVSPAGAGTLQVQVASPIGFRSTI